MKILNDFILLGANTARTKAYLQLMARNGLIPSYALIMSPSPESLRQEFISYETRCESLNQKSIEYFQLEEPVLFTLNEYGIPYTLIETDSVNSEESKKALAEAPSPYIVYSGFGGQILKKPVLELGKRFLHIHPGVVPEYRGSTTVYYSLLNEGRIGASAIFLEEKIDCGPVLKTKWFELKHPLPNLDYILDPFIRASLLVEVLKEFVDTGHFEFSTQSATAGETFYIIHPLLKHFAILSTQ
ncbi:formyltransferase family protein [Cohnella panacarvi]|uniref:formyltransferase family protein n=1 Tax=Cohnella panacarvi TaxID=400776 RepID=UPI00047DC735|nr:formyltransferase family protein [Cohnella panacarvi]